MFSFPEKEKGFVYLKSKTGLCHDHIGAGKRIVFCFGGSGGPFDRVDRQYEKAMPLTALAALRPGVDVAIIPNGPKETEIAGFYQQMLNFEPWQIQHAPGNFCMLETNVCGDMQHELGAIVREGPSLLLPAFRHDAADWLADRLGLPVCGDSWQWRLQFGKAALHQHVNERKRDKATLDLMSDFRIPRGYVAETVEELLRAFDLLEKEDVKRMLIKPAHSDAGEGIKHISNRDRRKVTKYDFKLGPVILEENVGAAFDTGLGSSISPSIHWAGDIIGLPTSQVVEDGEYYGMCYPSCLAAELEQRSREMVRSYVQLTKPKGLGGLDFICGEDGELYLVDINNGRCTEAIPPLLFASQYSDINANQILLTQKYVPDCTIWAMWERLQGQDIAWRPQQKENGSGVFPLMHLDGVSGMLIASAPTICEAKQLMRKALSPL